MQEQERTETIDPRLLEISCTPSLPHEIGISATENIGVSLIPGPGDPDSLDFCESSDADSRRASQDLLNLLGHFEFDEDVIRDGGLSIRNGACVEQSTHRRNRFESASQTLTYDEPWDPIRLSSPRPATLTLWDDAYLHYHKSPRTESVVLDDISPTQPSAFPICDLPTSYHAIEHPRQPPKVHWEGPPSLSNCKDTRSITRGELDHGTFQSPTLCHNFVTDALPEQLPSPKRQGIVVPSKFNLQFEKTTDHFVLNSNRTLPQPEQLFMNVSADSQAGAYHTFQNAACTPSTPHSSQLWGFQWEEPMDLIGDESFVDDKSGHTSHSISGSSGNESLHGLQRTPGSDYRILKSAKPSRALERSPSGSATSVNLPIRFQRPPIAQPQVRRHSTNAFEPKVLTAGLQVILHEPHGCLASSTTLTTLSCNGRRARRIGPLTNDQRGQAARTRKEKSVCIRCKKDKQPCRAGIPCTRCLTLGDTTAWKQPCTKAHFLDIVESGTCNYISQRAINHFTLDQTSRVRLELPETFELTELLTLIEARQHNFNIRARQINGSLYVLDLKKCHNFLQKISRAQNTSKHDLRDFIDRTILVSDDWLSCVYDCDPMRETMALLSQWNNMPSRASYDFVPLSPGSPDIPMNVEDPHDRLEILIAAQLSRIVCRKLEMAGYKLLQASLNNWAANAPDNPVRFVAEFGQVLLTLRWRVSWWELLGDGGTSPDQGKERFETRVRSLCQILYFYYFNLRRKIPAWTNPDALGGVWSAYADANPVFDDFPQVESLEAFEEWMGRGKELIKQADVKRRISRY